MTDHPWDPPDGVLVRTSFRVNWRDMANAQRANLRWRFSRPQAWTTPLLAGLALCAVEAAENPAASAAQLAAPFAYGFAAILAIRLVMYVVVPLLSRRHANSAYYNGMWEAEFTRAGLRARTPGAEIYNTWDHYVAKQEGRHTTLLYHRSGLFQFMPKSALTPAQREVVASLTAAIPRRG